MGSGRAERPSAGVGRWAVRSVGRVSTGRKKGRGEMDIYCRRCGEPWEIDSLHEAAEASGGTFEAVRRDFASRGCAAILDRWDGQHFASGPRCEARDLGTFGAILGAAEDLSGDDVDGMAADIEDWLMLHGGEL